ncbi:MAG: ThiF family adenylyltransferase [Planctomycetota bacterium]
MIVLSGEWIESLIQRPQAVDLSFLNHDEGDAFSVVSEDDLASSRACPGTLLVSNGMSTVDEVTVGKRTDRVRVIVSPRDTQGDPGATGCARCSAIEAKGYVLREGRWEAVPVQIVPVRKELYSRTKGLLETDVLADSSVFIAGQGSGGSFVTWELAKLGILNFALMDHDRLEVANVVRHMAGISDVGRYKTKAMADMIREKNPYAHVHTWETKVCWENIDLKL